MTEKVIARDLPNGDYLEIEVSVTPYFSVVGVLWEKRGTWSGRAAKRNGRECNAAGQITDEIKQAAPELEPLLAVHLSEPSGLPMHADANGWYLYSGASSAYEWQKITEGRDYGYSRLLQTSDHDRAAQALNISPDLLPKGLDHAGFLAFTRSLAETWQRQADAARRVFDSLTDGDGVEQTK